MTGSGWRGSILAIALCLAAGTAAGAQQPATAPQTNSPHAAEQVLTHITPEQASKLFSLVDELLQFSSQETGLPIKSTVKRQLTTRATVESYLKWWF